MIQAFQLLMVLVAMFTRGPVSRSVRDEATCHAPPMIQVMQTMIDAADFHAVPISVLTSVCFAEAGLNPCAQFCGVDQRAERWACDHGAACGGPVVSPELQALRQQIRASAFLLARQHRNALHGSWTYAAQGYHLGGNPRHLGPCPPSHHHHTLQHGVYGLIVLEYARRFEARLGIDTMFREVPADLWEESQQRQRAANRRQRPRARGMSARAVECSRPNRPSASEPVYPAAVSF